MAFVLTFVLNERHVWLSFRHSIENIVLKRKLSFTLILTSILTSIKINKMFSNELTAVVMSAGKGSRICELTANIPKCLVPIANKPLIYYPLESLIKSGFNGISL